MCRCLKDLEDECASSDYGGCWHQDYTVNGKTKTYSACKDNLEQYQVRWAIFPLLLGFFLACLEANTAMLSYVHTCADLLVFLSCMSLMGSLASPMVSSSLSCCAVCQ